MPQRRAAAARSLEDATIERLRARFGEPRPTTRVELLDVLASAAASKIRQRRVSRHLLALLAGRGASSCAVNQARSTAADADGDLGVDTPAPPSLTRRATTEQQQVLLHSLVEATETEVVVATHELERRRSSLEGAAVPEPPKLLPKRRSTREQHAILQAALEATTAEVEAARLELSRRPDRRLLWCLAAHRIS